MVQAEWTNATGEQASPQVSRQISQISLHNTDKEPQELADATSDESDFPNGGLKAWFVLFSSFG